MSSYWRHGEAVTVDFLPDLPRGWLRQAKRDEPRITLRQLLGGRSPTGLRKPCPTRSGCGSSWATWPTGCSTPPSGGCRLAIPPNGSEGFAKAEVTIGGISTAELSSQTMKSKRVPGLFAIGEAVDVTGWLGGYNFQWAWASAQAAAQAL